MNFAGYNQEKAGQFLEKLSLLLREISTFGGPTKQLISRTVYGHFHLPNLIYDGIMLPIFAEVHARAENISHSDHLSPYLAESKHAMVEERCGPAIGLKLSALAGRTIAVPCGV